MDLSLWGGVFDVFTIFTKNFESGSNPSHTTETLIAYTA